MDIFTFIKNTFKIATAYFGSLLQKNIYKSYWMIGERGVDARDNGYWFYKYMLENHPEQKVIYVINKDSPDFEKIRKCGGEFIEPNTIKHGVIFLSCEMLISSHPIFCCPNWKGMYFLLKHQPRKRREKHIFLQHGITKDYIPRLTAAELDADLFICGGKMEYEYVLSTYGFLPNVVQYTGFARFDNLYDSVYCKKNRSNKMVLLMPTWRHYLEDYKDKESFMKSEYFKKYNSLINNQMLGDLLTRNGYQLVFYPHFEIHKWIDCFESILKNVVIADFDNYDVQELLIDCNILITDYSSVFFDAAYMKKNIIFYQFDYDDYRKNHYQEGYFQYKYSFGPVVKDEASVIEQLKVVMMNGYESHYAFFRDSFFTYYDSNNCYRIYNAISMLKG